MTHASSGLVSGRLSAPAIVAAVGVLVLLGAASPTVAQCPNPASPIRVENPGTRYSSEGGSVLVPIVVLPPPPGAPLTYEAVGLPQGLSINATSGLITGTITATAGSYPVTVFVHAVGFVSNCQRFYWKVSEWLEGEVFAGYADYVGTYAWWSRDGQQLKGTLLVALGEISAGCASDWRTGDLFTTDFAFGTYRVSGLPGHAVEFFDSHSPAGSSEYRDAAPESVALANNGGFYVGHADGFYSTQIDPNTGNPVGPCVGVPDCVPADATGSPLVLGYDPADPSSTKMSEDLVAPGPSPGVPGEPVRDIDNQTLGYSSTAIGHYFVQVTGTLPEIVTPLKVDSGGGISAGGPGEYLVAGSRDAAGVPYWHTPLPAFYSTSIPIHPLYDVFPDVKLRPFYERTPGQPILGPGGALIPARLQDGRDLHVYRPDGSGGYNRSEYDTFVNAKGTDWIDLSSDQRTIFYTSEYGIVHRYDVETGTQLPPFAIVPESSLFAIRLLPPGDGTGGLLVAALRHVVRLNGAGHTVMTYQGRKSCAEDPDGCPDPAHFAVTIDPDGHRFWTGSYYTGDMYEFDIQTGRLLAGPVTNATLLAGLCVKLEYTAAQEICNDTPPVDDDGDGMVNENCAPLEICSPNLSPGDDDGDGLIDVNDPDCGNGTVPPEVCGDGIDNNDDGRIDEGTCDRQTAEQQPVAGVFLLPSYSEAPDRTFAVNPLFPLPPGLQLNTQTSEITGTPPCTAVTRLQGARTWPVRVVMTDSGGSSDVSFNWTVTNVSCAPLAVADSYGAFEDVPLAVAAAAGLLANDMGFGDTLSVTSYTQPSHGSVAVNPDGSFSYQPNADFWGSDTFTYTVDNGFGGTSSAAVTIAVSPVNDAPVAVAVTVTTNENTPAPVALTGTDTETAAGNLTFTVTQPPGHGTLSGTAPNLTYTPAANYNGPDSFAYTVTDRGKPDGCGAPGPLCAAPLTSMPATVTITVGPVNTPPIAGAVAVTTNLNTSVPVRLVGTDTETAAANLIFTVTQPPAHGTLSGTAPNLTYTPATNYYGPDSFAYTVTDRGDPDGCGTPGPACDATRTSAEATVTITVVANRPPSCTAATAQPATIWPPNHRFVPISIRGVTDPDGNPVTIKVTGIYQDEPTNTDGDGSHTPDGKGVGTSKASVRAERSGTKKTPGNGRVYMIGFSATDPSGAFCTGVVTVCVPHDQGGHSACVNDGPLYDSTVTLPKLPSHDEDHCSVPGHDHTKGKGGKGGKDGDKDRGNPWSWMMSYWRWR